MEFDTPIAAACKRMTMLIEARYLTPDLQADLRTLMHGAMAYEVITAKTPVESPDDFTSTPFDRVEPLQAEALLSCREAKRCLHSVCICDEDPTGIDKSAISGGFDAGQNEALNCIGPMLDDWDKINPDDKVTIETMAPNFVHRIRQLRRTMDRQ